MTHSSDYLIIGGGIIGLTVARELRLEFPDASIILIDKEPDVARHASGRNSGVLHAGFYYSADSLKAQFCREGNTAMKAYVKEKGLRINECQKVVVTQNEGELDILHELYRRGEQNNVPLQLIDEQELADIEPNAKTVGKAIHATSTAIIDPVEICQSLYYDLRQSNVTVHVNTPYQRRISAHAIQANKVIYEADHIINCAGLYADKIARDFSFGQDYAVIPFKGVYLKYNDETPPIKRCIYPVPNLNNPFLGVHYSITVDGIVKIGPTAMPAFWRENYAGMAGFSLAELIEVMRWEMPMFAFDSGFRKLAANEMRKYSKHHMASLASKMVNQIDASKFDMWGKPGIRAQLIRKRDMTLLHDFVVEGDASSTHILNAVSPAFTSSFPFAQWIIKHHIKKA